MCPSLLGLLSVLRAGAEAQRRNAATNCWAGYPGLPAETNYHYTGSNMTPKIKFSVAVELSE